MTEVPGIWRVELIHPLVVHFPLVLLLSGTLAWLAGQWVASDGRWAFLLPAGRLMLSVGAASAWVAVYTGHLADAEVVRTLCDPTVVETHEQYATWVAAIFTGALLVEFASILIDALDRWRTPLSVTVALAIITGSTLLGYVGHLGSTLVYQQGAAVYHPSEACTEFE
jgi:uncharacterized membrane protein